MGTEIGTIIEMDNSWKFQFFVTVITDKKVLRNYFNQNLYITALSSYFPNCFKPPFYYKVLIIHN